jgi:hypothetical protein
MESVRAATKRGNTWRRLIQCVEGTCCRTGTGTGTVQECLIHSLVVLKRDLPGPWQMIRGTQPGTQPRDAALWAPREANVIGRGMRCASSGGLQLPKGGSVRLGIGKGSTIPSGVAPVGGRTESRWRGGEATDSCSATSACCRVSYF